MIAILGGGLFAMGMSRGEWPLQGLDLAVMYGGYRFGSGPPDPEEAAKPPSSE